MTGDFHLAPDLADRPIRLDQEGRPLDAHVFASIHALFDPDAISFQRRFFLVGRQVHLKVMLGLEFVVALGAVGRHADQDDASGIELGLEPGKVDGFGRAAAGVVLGIEEEHHRFAGMCGERDIGAAVSREVEIRRLATALQFSHREVPVLDYLEARSDIW